MSRLDELGKAPVSGWRRVAWVLVAAIAAFIVWTYFADLGEVAIAPGEVVPRGQVKVIQHLEGGIIEQIYVEEGDPVAVGDPLVQLDLGTTGPSEIELGIELDGLLLRRARLEAEARGSGLVFPEDAARRRPELVEAERQSYQARAREAASTTAMLHDQTRQRELDLQQLEAEQAAVSVDLELARENFAMSSSLIEQGLTSKMEHLEIQREVEALEGKLTVIAPAIPRAQAAMSEAQERVREEGLSFQREAREELSQVELMIARKRELLAKATEQAARTEIRSPIDGIVQSLRYHTIGGVVRPGEAIMEIVPTRENLVIEAKLSPIDVGYVRVGQSVVVKISTYDFARYGGLEGEVIHISPDAHTDVDGRPYFRVVTATERTYLGDAPGELPITPGMEATVEIHTGSKSVMDFLLKPIIKAKEEAFRER